MTQDKLKQNIMRRVYVIYLIKRVTTPFLLKYYTFVFLVAFGAFTVSVKNVLLNMPHWRNINEVYGFYTSAFLHTQFAVQALIVGVSLIFFFIIKDIVSSFRKPKRHLVFTR